jgi:endonuclease/exonuclease/phosphatase family metal-dependent hydrolase
MPFVADWLTDNLNDYIVLGCGRSRNLDDEQMTVAFRKDKYSLISMETFWFSPYPHYPGSRYVTMCDWPRTCTEAVLREKATGDLFRVCNLHMDNLYDHARAEGVKQLMRKIKDTDVFENAHVIIAGDFNAEPGDASIRRMDPSFRDAAACSGPTYHGFGTAERPVKIDYIWVQDDLEASGLQVWDECHDGVYLSDHYPLCVDLNIRK